MKRRNFIAKELLTPKFKPKIIKPKKTILTNLHSTLDYEKLKKKLPKNVYPAFDGMKLIIN